LTGAFFLLCATIHAIQSKGVSEGSGIETDPESKKIYNYYISFSCKIQTSWDGIIQHRRLHYESYAMELMIIIMVLAMIIPRVPLETIVYPIMLFLFIFPGVYFNWIVAESTAPSHPDRIEPDEPLEEPPVQAPRRTVPRMEASTAPPSAFHRHRH